MTIRFTCSCGQELAAREEHAGKRVKCTACGDSLTVPGGKTATATADPPDDFIRFTCSCGQTCQARAETAGKRTRCPSCEAILTIPSPTAGRSVSARSAGRSSSIQAERPSGRSATRTSDFDADFDDDDYRDEDDRDVGAPRPRRKKKKIKKKGAPWALIGASAALVLLLGGGGLGLWLWLRGGSSEDFDLVPRDAQMFFTIRVADGIDTPLGKRAMDMLRAAPGNPLQQLERKGDLTINDIERVTFVFTDLKKEEWWAVIKTSKVYSKEKTLKDMPNHTEQKYKGETYYQSGREAFYFVSKYIMVVGSAPGVRKCIDLPDDPKSGPLDEAIEVASGKKYHMVLGVNVPSLMQQLQGQMGGMGGMPGGFGGMPGGDPFAQMKDMKDFYMGATISDGIRFDATATFTNEAAALAAEQLSKQQMQQARNMLPMLGMMAGGLPGLDVNRLTAEARKVLDSVKTTRDGATLTQEVTIEKGTIDFIIDTIQQAMQGMGGRGGRPGI